MKGNLTMNIDWTFISEREGGRKLMGYIPKSNGEVLDSSGVTIATGFDIGQYSTNDLKKMGVPYDLIEILEPYCEFTGQEAEEVMISVGVPEITETEAFELDKASHERTLSLLRNKYDEVASCCFSALHPQIQTAIASVAFQYGTGLKRRTPMFWKQITGHDWEAAIANLKNFGDKYPSRRKLEANLIESCMS